MGCLRSSIIAEERDRGLEPGQDITVELKLHEWVEERK